MKSSQMIRTVEDNSRAYEERLRAIERLLSSTNELELQIERNIVDCLRRLAVIQLEAPTSLDRDVQHQLTLRRDDEASTRGHLEDIEAGIARNVEKLAQTKESIQGVEACVLETLSRNSEYVRLSAGYAQAVQIHEGASDAYAEIEFECHSKLADYDQNRLYRYLTGVGYGSGAYSRRGILRTLDHWIAGLCNFPTNRENETMLLAMQKENERTQGGRKAKVDELRLALDRMVADTEKDTDMGRLVKERDELAASIATDKERANDLHGRLADYANKVDGRYLRAREMLTESLKSTSIARLIAEAEATPDDSDNRLVEEVIRLKQDFEEHQERYRCLQAEREQADRQYSLAKDLERQLRGSSYASDYYEYSVLLDIDGLLAAYMAGRISSDAVLRELASLRRAVFNESIYYSSSSGSTYGGRVWGGFGSSNTRGSSGSGGGSSMSHSSGGGGSSAPGSSGGSDFSTSGSSGGGGYSTSGSF